MSVVVYNTNSGHGTFNNVSGNQINQNSIIAFYGPSRYNDVCVDEQVTITNERYHALLQDIAFIRARFSALRELWPRDPSIIASCEHLDEFARIFGFAARAVEIIADIPGAAKTLRFFEKIRSLIDQCQLQFATIRGEITIYHEVQQCLTPGFWRLLLAFIYAIYFWCPVIKRLQILLSGHRKTLQRFLRFLTTPAWRSLISARHGWELDCLIRQTGLHEDSLGRDVDIQKILVVDHLGRRLVVPIEFCASWPDFDLLIKHYCKSVIGGELVMKNAWEIIQGRNDQVIPIRNFAQTVQPGMLLEMSIVLWKYSSLKKVCPRCEYDNSGNNEYNGWIECHGCAKRFKIRSPTTSGEVKNNSQSRKPSESFIEMFKHATQAFKRQWIDSELDDEAGILDADSTPTHSPHTNRDEVYHFNRITVRVQEILLGTTAGNMTGDDVSRPSDPPSIATTSFTPSVGIPTQEEYQSDTSSHPGDASSSRRPARISELAERVRNDLGEEGRGLKYYLRVAERARKESKQSLQEGDLENAFVQLARAATLALETLPSHPDYQQILTSAQRYNLSANGQEMLDELGKMKLVLVDRYDKWVASHPGADQAQETKQQQTRFRMPSDYTDNPQTDSISRVPSGSLRRRQPRTPWAWVAPLPDEQPSIPQSTEYANRFSPTSFMATTPGTPYIPSGPVTIVQPSPMMTELSTDYVGSPQMAPRPWTSSAPSPGRPSSSSVNDSMPSEQLPPMQPEMATDYIGYATPPIQATSYTSPYLSPNFSPNQPLPDRLASPPSPLSPLLPLASLP